jgi:ABC-type glycerol-3-phosphate transport system substrate-binding protein
MNRKKRYKVVIGSVCLFFLILGGTTLAARKVINVWHTETNPLSRKAVANIVERFEKLHPDIKVEAEALAWGDLEGKIMAALAAGSPPELSHGQPITCAALQAKGLLLPLDEVVKHIGEDNIWDQIKKVGKFGDHYYGLVHAAGTSLLVYRKDLAKKKGLKNPKTWKDLLHNAKELTMRYLWLNHPRYQPVYQHPYRGTDEGQRGHSIR